MCTLFCASPTPFDTAPLWLRVQDADAPSASYPLDLPPWQTTLSTTVWVCPAPLHHSLWYTPGRPPAPVTVRGEAPLF
jgi:hypothetical protein